MWTVVSGWLSPEQRKKTLLVNKDELAKYVAADQLEPHMRSAAAQWQIADWCDYDTLLTTPVFYNDIVAIAGRPDLDGFVPCTVVHNADTDEQFLWVNENPSYASADPVDGAGRVMLCVCILRMYVRVRGRGLGPLVLALYIAWSDVT